MNAVHSASSHTRSAQRFAIFVNICIAVALIALARVGALLVPPAIEMWAPNGAPDTFLTSDATESSAELNSSGGIVSAAGMHSSRGTQPFRGIHRRPAAPDLEMEMRSQRGIAHSNS